MHSYFLALLISANFWLLCIIETFYHCILYWYTSMTAEIYWLSQLHFGPYDVAIPELLNFCSSITAPSSLLTTKRACMYARVITVHVFPRSNPTATNIFPSADTSGDYSRAETSRGRWQKLLQQLCSSSFLHPPLLPGWTQHHTISFYPKQTWPECEGCNWTWRFFNEQYSTGSTKRAHN